MKDKYTEEQILALLSSIEGSGAFMTSGEEKAILPGMQIEGVGEVGFPISPILIKEIIKQAHKAPFGKGSQTITDENVRKTWEIDGEKISFLNPAWEKHEKKILKNVKEELGLSGLEIEHSLYKLLIYEEGGFFLPHKDSEKEPGMFGTLIIALPSKHSGGELFVRFEGEEKKVDFSGPTSNYQIAYVAFYADCEHEVKPVTEGYRVCLVYNLIQKSASKPLLPGFSFHEEEIYNHLRTIKAAEDSFPKIILLGHEYTPANFSRSALKLHDRPRAEILFAAAEKAGFFATLGLVTHYQMGQLEGGDYGYGYGRYSKPEEESMGEVYEEYTQIEHWASDGPTLGTMTVDIDDVISDIDLGEGEPTEEMAEGYTGNAGMTMEYWYHYGAVILWPRDRHAEILAGTRLTVRGSWIKYYLDHWDKKEIEPEKNLRGILTGLSGEDFEVNWHSDELDFNLFPKAFVKLGDEKLVKEYGLIPLEKRFEKITVESWLEIFDTFDHFVFEDIFQRIGLSNQAEKQWRMYEIMRLKLSRKEVPLTAFFLYQLDLIPKYLKALEISKTSLSVSSWQTIDRKKPISRIVYEILTLSIWRNDSALWVEEILKVMTESLPRVYANDILAGNLIRHPFKEGNLWQNLQHKVVENLKMRTEEKPQPPADWRREVPKTQNSWNDRSWDLLRPFLESPTQKTFDYVRVKAERESLERIISGSEVDLRMETIRKGSPHTLRLIKTDASYQRKLKKWEEDMGLLGKLGAGM